MLQLLRGQFLGTELQMEGLYDKAARYPRLGFDLVRAKCQRF